MKDASFDLVVAILQTRLINSGVSYHIPLCLFVKVAVIKIYSIFSALH